MKNYTTTATASRAGTYRLLREFVRMPYAMMRELGIDPRKFKKLRDIARFIRSAYAWKRAAGRIDGIYPILGDWHDSAGTVEGHYFHQDLLVAGFVFDAKPHRHVDVGSRVDGLVAHIAAFREIDVFDVRSLPDIHPNIRFTQANLQSLTPNLIGCCDSISCLHALEHFGLGRYGDPLDPDGHLRGIESLTKMLKPGGRMYLSFPIGPHRVEFNAQRVFDPNDLRNWIAELDLPLALIRMDVVDDSGYLHRDVQRSASVLTGLWYGCGIYTLLKTAPVAA